MTNQLKTTEIDALVSLARQPSALKAAAEAHAREVVERQALNDRIADLDRSAEKTWPIGQQAIEAAAKKVRAAERSLRDANDALAKAHTDAFNASMTYTRERQSAELKLIEGADLPTIEAWKNELLTEMYALQKPGVIVTSQTVERSEVTRQQVRTGYSNIKSIHARMKAVCASYEDADFLKLEPDQRKLPAIIAAARSGWPLVDNDPGTAKS